MRFSFLQKSRFIIFTGEIFVKQVVVFGSSSLRILSNVPIDRRSLTVEVTYEKYSFSVQARIPRSSIVCRKKQKNLITLSRFFFLQKNENLRSM